MATKNKRTTNATETKTTKSVEPSKAAPVVKVAPVAPTPAPAVKAAPVAPVPAVKAAPVAPAPAAKAAPVAPAPAAKAAPVAPAPAVKAAPVAEDRTKAHEPKDHLRNALNAIVHFTHDWRQVAKGAIVAGGQLTIEYDPKRAQLRDSKSGVPSWGVQAYVRTVPSGVVVERPVVEFETEKGKPIDSPKLLPLTVEVPAGTTEIEVWFKNWTASDCPRETWDSNFGKNYRFPVSQ